MNSIQNIVDKIIKEANDFADEKIALANSERDEILSSARNEAESILKGAKEQSEQNAKIQEERAQASGDSLVSNAILRTKVEILDKVFSEASEYLKNMSDEDFTRLMTSMLKEASPSSFSKIVINSKRKGCANALKEAFCKIYDFGCEIDFDDNVFGMLVIYGDITADCTYDAMLKEQRPRLEAKIAKLLFEE